MRINHNHKQSIELRLKAHSYCEIIKRWSWGEEKLVVEVVKSESLHGYCAGF